MLKRGLENGKLLAAIVPLVAIAVVLGVASTAATRAHDENRPFLGVGLSEETDDDQPFRRGDMEMDVSGTRGSAEGVFR